MSRLKGNITLGGKRVGTERFRAGLDPLLQVGFHFREISFDSRSVFVGECISPVFSVVCSTPTISLVFVSGLLLPRCYLTFRILGGSSPTTTIGFLLGLLLLLLQSLGFNIVLLRLCLTGCSW